MIIRVVLLTTKEKKNGNIYAITVVFVILHLGFICLLLFNKKITVDTIHRIRVLALSRRNTISKQMLVVIVLVIAI